MREETVYRHFLLASLVLILLGYGAVLCRAQPSSQQQAAEPAREVRSAPAGAQGNGRSTVEEEANSLLQKLDQLDRLLLSIEARREELSTRIAHSARRIAQIEGRPEESTEGGALESQKALAARLVALYKFKQMGYATPLLTAKALDDIMESGYVAAKLLANDHLLLSSFQERRTNTRSNGAEATQERKQLNELKLQMASLEREVHDAQQEKRKLLERVRGNESFFARYSATVEENQKILQRRALNRKPIFDDQGKSFTSRQGSLPLPTQGEIVGTFGSKTHVSSRSILYNGGMIIGAPKGQQIQAIHEGVVVFADWLKEYGKVMIIDHGEHYYSLIAHADQFFKKVGDTVRDGEIIATVGDTGSLDGPKLYFEIRHHGKPVDPTEWLAVRKSSKE